MEKDFCYLRKYAIYGNQVSKKVLAVWKAEEWGRFFHRESACFDLQGRKEKAGREGRPVEPGKRESFVPSVRREK